MLLNDRLYGKLKILLIVTGDKAVRLRIVISIVVEKDFLSIKKVRSILSSKERSAGSL